MLAIFFGPYPFTKGIELLPYFNRVVSIPGTLGASENPYPGILGHTTSKGMSLAASKIKINNEKRKK